MTRRTMRTPPVSGLGLAIAFLVAMGTLPLVPGEAQAGGFSNPDFGGRRMGMFSVVGKPDDVTAIFHNPAGLTLSEGTQFAHTQSWFLVDLGLKFYDSKGLLRPDKELGPELSIGFIPFFGVTSDLGTKNLRVGFALYAPNAYGAWMSDQLPTRYHAIKALFLASRASGSIAYRFSDKLSVGLSVNLIYVYLMAQRMMNPNVLSDPDRRFDSPADSKPFDALLELNGQDWTWGWDLGILFEPTKTFKLGVDFASGSKINIKGDVKLTYLSNNKVERSTHETAYVIPFTLRAGMNWEFAKDFEWGLDIFWWHYQVLQEQRSILSSPIMGIGEFRDPKNFSNSWAWNTGLLYRIHPKLELMVGWQMDFTCIPWSTWTLDMPTTNQSGVGAGARWKATDKLKVSIGFVRNWFELVNNQESRTNPPANVKGHGGNTEFSFDLTYTL